MTATAFRPKRLSDILGQGPVVAELRQFVEQPCSAGFLFVGESGIGKSSTAEALAAELDCSPSERTTIPSGQLDGDTLLWVEKMLRYAPMSGWRVVVFEEADLMTVKAERLFLTILESLPPRTVLIFTSNRMEWFDARIRLRDRLEVYQFASRADDLRQDAEQLVGNIWESETGSRNGAPALDSLGPIVDMEGNISFRRVATAVSRLLRKNEPFRLQSPKQAEPDLFSRKPQKPEPEPEPEFIPYELVEAVEPSTYNLADDTDELVPCEIVPTPEEIAVEFIANMPRYTIQPATAVIAAQFNADPAVVATAIKARKWA